MRNFVIVFFVLSILNLVTANLRTSCDENQKLYANLCFAPKPELDWDFEWFHDNQPTDSTEGWYGSIGNDVYQLHFSEIIKGEQIRISDHDFTDMCYRFHVNHKTGDGQLHAYGVSSDYTCRPSKDYPGVQLCDLQLDHSKYHMNSTTYISYRDKTTKFAVVIDCFQNGRVGWATINKHPKLTEEEKKIVNSHVEGLGFKMDTVEILHGENCPKFNKLQQ